MIFPRYRFFLCSLLISSGFVQAVEYTAGTTLELGGEYNDNVRLSEGGIEPIEIIGYVTALDLSLNANTETIKSSLGLNLASSAFDEQAFDSDDQVLDASVEKSTPLLAYGAGVEIIRDSTRTSELLDSGLIGAAARREVFSYSGYLRKTVSSKSLLQLNASTTAVDFQTDLLTGYDYSSFDLSWYYTLSPRTTLISQVMYSIYDSDNTAFQKVSNNTAGFYLGGEFSLSDSWKANILAGSQQVESEVDFLFHGDKYAQVTDSSHSSYLNAGVTYLTKRQKGQFTLARQVQPSSLGYEQIDESVTYQHTYKVSQLSKTNLTLRYGRNESAEGSRNDTRDYSTLRLSWDRKLSAELIVSMSYVYFQQDRESVDGEAESNSVNIGLIYTPTSKHWSR